MRRRQWIADTERASDHRAIKPAWSAQLPAPRSTMPCIASISSARLLAIVLSWWVVDSSICFDKAFAEPPGAEPSRPTILAEFDIDQGGAPLMIPAVISGKTYRLMLDTGAAFSVLHVAHRAALGQAVGKVDTETLAGEVEVDLFRVRNMQIGALTLAKFYDMSCIPLHAFKDAQGKTIDGLLGMDVLRDFVIEIDFDAGKLRFCKSAVEAGRAVRLSWDDQRDVAFWDRTPAMLGMLDGAARAENFLIDTGGIGTNAGSLRADVYDALLKSGRLAPASAAPDEYVVHAGGRIDLKRGRASGLSMGGYHHRQLLFLRVPDISSLGLGYFARYRVTFDFPNSIMYLRPGKAFGRRDVFDLSGLRLVKRDSAIMCDWVRERSAGETAGVMAGDIIIAIDGQPANELNLFSARRALSVEGRHVVDLSRDGVAKRLDLHLMEPPPPRAAVNRPQSRAVETKLQKPSRGAP